MERLDIEFAYAACALFCALVGALYDVASRRIPNAFTLPAMVFGLLLHFAFGGWRQLGSAAAGGLICGLIFLLFHLAGGMGGGDVKLIVAVGCTTGFSGVAPLLLLTSLAGGVMALGLALFRGRLQLTLSNMWALALHHGRAGLARHPDLNLDSAQALRLPYAVPIAMGSALSLCLLMVQR